MTLSFDFDITYVCKNQTGKIIKCKYTIIKRQSKLSTGDCKFINFYSRNKSWINTFDPIFSHNDMSVELLPLI